MRQRWISFVFAGLALPSALSAQSPIAASVNASMALQASPDGTRRQRDMRDDFNSCIARPQTITRLNADRIAACDRALRDPSDDVHVWHRQAVLLHNKAVWQFASGLDRDALASLDMSDAAAASTRDSRLVFDGSTGIANMMLRALLLDRQNRRADALSLLEQARTVRPYSLSILLAIDRYEMAITRDIDRLRPMTERHLRTDPMAVRQLFHQQFFAGELAAAEVTAEQVFFGRPALIGGWVIAGKDPVEENLAGEIELLYLRAYIRAALGDAAGSAAMFDRVEERLAAYAGPQPVPTPQRRRVRPADLQAWQARVGRADQLRQAAANWRTAIEMRAEVASGAGLEIFEQPRFREVINLPAGLDVLRAVANANLGERAEIMALLRSEQEKALRDTATMDTDEAIRLLPEAESLLTYPRFGHADGVLVGRELGYSQAPLRDGDVRTIRFGTRTGSGATADELVILAAATYAQREGLDSFLILGRHLLDRNVTVSGYFFSGPRAVDAGNEGAVLAVLVDSNALPARWEAHRSRLIRVADVMSSLGARQQAIEAAKTAEQARR